MCARDDQKPDQASVDAGTEAAGGGAEFRRQKTRAVVLAGVHAWGNCALEELVCRPLLPIASRPLIWHTLNWARRNGIHEASICGNSDTGVLRRALGNCAGLDMSLAYSEDVMPRGPAGCARDAVIPTDAETVIVIDGTIVPCIDIDALLRAHEETQAAVTIVVGPTVAEKPDNNQLEPIGVYVFSRSALERVPDAGYQDIKEALIPALYRAGERVVPHVVNTSSAPRVTDAASYLAVNMWVIENLAMAGCVPASYVRIGDAWVDSTAQIAESARFVGPVLIGPNTVVKEGALIVGPTTVGAGCTIGAQSVISRCAVWNKCNVGDNTILDQCVVTDDAVVDSDLVVRETVFVPPRRPERKLLGRLAAFCRPGSRRNPSARNLQSEPSPLQA